MATGRDRHPHATGTGPGVITEDGCPPTIEDLDLGTTFDVVLLASHLVNTPAHGSRQALLTTCCRHVHADGQVVLQRCRPGWAEAADGTTSEIADGIVHAVHVVASSGDGRYTLEATTRVGPRQWIQRYTMQELDDDALDQHLRRAGLQLERWISDDGTWVTAVTRPFRA